MSDDRTSGLTRFGRWLRLHLLRVIRENASPGRTALGFGLGAFIAIFPTLLFGTPLAFIVAAKLKLNRAAAVAGATGTVKARQAMLCMHGASADELQIHVHAAARHTSQ